MTWGLTAIAGATISSASKSSSAAGKAAKAQVGAATDAAALERQTAREQLALQERMYEEGVARQQPWLSAGQNALAQLQNQYNAMPAAFTGQVDLTQDPGYAFRLSEGQKALERSAAARGGLLSGATGKNLLRFGQEMGSQEYEKAYARAMDKYNAAMQREATGYNRLANMAGIGQTTAQQLGAAGQTYAQQAGATSAQSTANINDLLTGAANALTQALGTGANLYMQSQLLNRLPIRA